MNPSTYTFSEITPIYLLRRRRIRKTLKICGQRNELPYGRHECKQCEMNASCFRQIHYEAVDFVIYAIEKRFKQPKYQPYVAFENLLIKPARNEDF